MNRDEAVARRDYDNQIERYSKLQSESKIIQDIRKRVTLQLGNIKNKKVLFVGCGDGKECIEAVNKGAKVTGVDISAKAIELAKRNCPSAEFYVRSFNRLGFRAGSFDVVVSTLSSMYSSDLAGLLIRFKRLLKNGGRIVLTVPHPTRKMIKYSKMNYFVKGRRKEIWRGTRRYNYYMLFEDYINAFNRANLKLAKLIEPKPVKEEAPDATKFEMLHPHHMIFTLVKE